MELQVKLVRPFDFSDREYHAEKWRKKNITVLICQRNTKDLIRLSLESLLRFYPDIPILIMDEGSAEESIINYLKYKSILNPNITVIEGKDKTSKFTSHGDAMDNALKNHIRTKYVLLMDSDVIIERGGLIEEMLNQFVSDPLLYATGSLMIVTRKNHACGAPQDDSDKLRYAHPSFSVYDVEKYHELNTPFVNHGAPCVYNMMEAEKRALHIAYYPVDKYVSHLSGGSWTEPRTIWANDHNVFVRPFVTFILSDGNHIKKLQLQNDHDFDIITLTVSNEKHIVVHGSLPIKVNNNLYDIRHHIYGEYVCVLPDNLETIQPNFVQSIKYIAIEQKMPDEMNVGGLKCIKRTIWQGRESLQ